MGKTQWPQRPETNKLGWNGFIYLECITFPLVFKSLYEKKLNIRNENEQVRKKIFFLISKGIIVIFSK